MGGTDPQKKYAINEPDAWPRPSAEREAKVAPEIFAPCQRSIVRYGRVSGDRSSGWQEIQAHRAV